MTNKKRRKKQRKIRGRQPMPHCPASELWPARWTPELHKKTHIQLALLGLLLLLLLHVLLTSCLDIAP
jgi:hypothetical protein